MKARAAMVAGAFEKLDVRLDPNSRLARQIDTYLDRKGVLPQIIEPDHPQFPVIVEAQRDLNQVAFALKELLPTAPREELRTRLRRLVADNVLPQDNPHDSPGRDAQCELFVAALCARAGFDPKFHEQPDLHCKFDKQTLGVAIKRIKTAPERFEERFRECVREASNQIRNSQFPGIIVADISQSRNPTNWWIPREVSDFQFDVAWRASVGRFKSRFESPLLAWTEGKRVRGVILIDHILRCPPVGPWRTELMCWSISLCPHNERRRREFELFDAKFEKAICNPEGPT